MKKIIYSLPLLLVIGLFVETASAQPGFPISPSGAQSIQIQNKLSKTVQVFPNPCTGQFVVRFNSSTSGKTGITVFDFNGNPMIAVDIIATIGLNTVPLDITAYGNGFYSVTVSGGGFFGTAPVVVK